ncbi:MAG TPA: S8 family serine peptidase [Bdellovibrionota bacterium]|nr:S8 family serine peptidase [Bdellovibrionota bacterium]
MKFTTKTYSSALSLLALGALSSAQAKGVDKLAWAEYVPGEFVVKAKADAQTFSTMASTGLKFKQSVNALEHVMLVERDESAALRSLGLDARVSSKGLDRAIRRALENSQNFEYVEPNFIYRLSEHTRGAYVEAQAAMQKITSSSTGLIPNDPKFAELWGMLNVGQQDSDKVAGVAGADIDATQAWELGTGSKDVVVAIIDTGIDYNHPDLVDNVWSAPHPDPAVGGVIHGYNAINGSYDPMDDNEHGTHCAGTIGGVGNNGIGVTGVSWNVSMMGVKFLSGSGSGTLADAIKAIDFATSQNVDVMSNSWGGGGFSQALKESIERASEKGIVFVAAAGNSSADNDTAPAYPATYDVPNVISVAATTNLDTLASFSSYGKRTVHVAAPGHNIVSTTPNNTYASFSGTSMATPHVSGAVALFKSQRGAGMSPTQIREEIQKTAERVNSLKKKVAFGGSRLNVYNLLADVAVPGPVVVPADQWSEMAPLAIETEHPYANNAKNEWRITGTGKFMRLHFSAFDTENRYDAVYVINAQTREVLDTISGDKGAFVTEQLDASDVIVRFESDNTVNKHGFAIEGYSTSDYTP